MTLAEYLKSIADAIRARKETTAPINAQNFAAEIMTLGPKFESIDITENGEYDVEDYKVAKVLVPTGDTAIGLIQRDITEYNIPYGTTRIGSYAFYNFSNLKSVGCPETVTDIESYAFESCGLQQIAFPSSLEVIGDYAFSGSSLQSVDIPNGVAYVGSYSFRNCKSLTNVTIPESVTKLNPYTFQNCGALANVNFHDGIKEFGDYCFETCQNLTIDDKLPSNLEVIGARCFRSCQLSSTGTLIIPASVTSIGEEAFSYSYPGEPFSVVFLGSLATIPNNCFSSTPITSITFPTGLTEIGNGAFYNCDQLTKIDIPYGVTTINKNTCANCDSLTEVVIPKSVTLIDYDAFKACPIKTFYIPSSVYYISFGALKSSSPGYNVVMESETPCRLYDKTFLDETKLGKIFVPRGTSQEYKSADKWSYYADYIYEFITVSFNIDTGVMNNENYLYSIDNGATWEQFTEAQFSIDNAHVVRFKNTDAETTLLIGTTEGGSDIATIANAETTYASASDTTIYVSLA